MPGKRYDRQFKLAAARLVVSEDMPVAQISDDLEVPCNTLRRWAAECAKDGEDAFPGSGSHRVNKDYETLKLRKENGELRKEVGFLREYRAFLRRGPSRDSSS